jgi:hypothetical protein
LLHGARSFGDHAAQLAAALRGEVDAERSRRFVQTFVRPHGTREAATPRVVEAIEQLPAVAPRLAPERSGPMTRLAVQAFLALATTRAGWLLSYDEAGVAKERRKHAERAA